jgi:hypothetical protein
MLNQLLSHFLRAENLSPAMGRGINSSRNRVWNWVAKLHRLAGRYDNPMPTWFLAPIAVLKLPTQKDDLTLSSYLFSALGTGSLVQNKMATDNALAQSSTHTADRAGACVSVYMACRAGGGGGVLYKVGPGRALNKLVEVPASRNYGLIRERRWPILSFWDNNYMIILPSSVNSIKIFKVDVKISETFAQRSRKFSKRAGKTVSQAHPQPDRPADCDKVYAESIE